MGLYSPVICRGCVLHNLSAPRHKNYCDCDYFTVGFTSMPNHQHYYSFIIPWYDPTSSMRAMFGIFTYSGIWVMMNSGIWIMMNSGIWVMMNSGIWVMMNFCLISVFLTFSHIKYITSSAQFQDCT